MNPSPSPTLTRREALRRILVASALAATLDITAFAADDLRRIGHDPNMLAKEIPWPRILTDDERRIVTTLADVIVPADEHGPAASTVGVTDFIDEWVSAPDTQQRDLGIIRKGLAWIDGEAKKRFGETFRDGDLRQLRLLRTMLRDSPPSQSNPVWPRLDAPGPGYRQQGGRALH